MTTATAPTSLAVGAAFDPPALDIAARYRWAWLGPVASLALLALALRAIGAFPLRLSLSALPGSGAFWVAFALFALSTPISDWIIYRRLWAIPTSGLIALLRKHVLDRLLFGYMGEIYFYGWARQHGKVAAAPFGAIKDVAILSAVCGNLVALATLPMGIAVVRQFVEGGDPRLLTLSLAVFTAMTLLPIVLRRMLFSLPTDDLRFVALVQTGRAIAGIALFAAMGHLLLPGQSYLVWLLLAAMRQIVTRLPFVPDDNVVFTAIAVFFMGHEPAVAGLLALIAALLLALEIALGLGLAGWGLAARNRA